MAFLYEVLRDLTVLAWGHKRAAGEVLLVLALLFVGWRAEHAKAKLEQEKQVTQGLANNLAEQVTIRDHQLEILKRDSAGKVVYQKIYVPPEGYVVDSEKQRSEMQAQLDSLSKKLQDALGKGDGRAADEIRKEIDKVGSDTIVDVHDHGFTHRLGGRVDYANGHGLDLGLDMKVYFWKRFGLVFGGTDNGIGPGLSYHLDWIPYLHPQNLEFFLNYNIIRLADPRHPVAGGLRIDF